MPYCEDDDDDLRPDDDTPLSVKELLVNYDDTRGIVWYLSEISRFWKNNRKYGSPPPL